MTGILLVFIGSSAARKEELPNRNQATAALSGAIHLTIVGLSEYAARTYLSE
ncbi:MAG: hypothetical protein MUE59_04710 [Thiobacillaceae bacterium]|nr:hypothetical protein [Thiobacillaceae bacterium]